MRSLLYSLVWPLASTELWFKEIEKYKKKDQKMLRGLIILFDGWQYSALRRHMSVIEMLLLMYAKRSIWIDISH